MSVNKKDYKIVEEQHGYETRYVVKKRILCFFWRTAKTKSGEPAVYITRRAAQAYINFLK